MKQKLGNLQKEQKKQETHQKLLKPQREQDNRILSLYNSENGQDACCVGSNGQCAC